MSIKFKFFTAIAAFAMLIGLVLPSAVSAQSEFDWDSYNDSSYTFNDSDYDSYDELSDEDAAAILAITSAYTVCYGCFFLFFYIFSAITLAATAKKVGITEGLWMAWVPFANIYLMTKIANLEVLHFFLSLFVPFWGMYVYAKMLERRNMSPWLVLLFFVPFGMFIVMGMLAWSNTGPATPVAQTVA
jgi:hypothetical protein